MSKKIEAATAEEQNVAIKTTVSPTGGMSSLAGYVSWAFKDGRALKISLSDLTPELREMAALHGLKQKIGDAAAISRDPASGRSATLSTKYDAAREVLERLTISQTWNKGREGGGATGGLLLRALCQFYSDKEPEEVRAWLETMDDAKKQALRVNPKISELIMKLKAEKPETRAIDSDALLAGFGS